MASNLTPDQQKVLSRILTVARKKGASPKQIKAAVETGLVESNLKNLPGGDADSAGWRQERASIYPNPTNLDASISRFFDETAKVKNSYGRAGDLAAAVQRPAAQYRGRYQQRSGEAQALLGGKTSATPAQARTSSVRTPGVDNSALRAQAVQDFLGSKSGDPVSFAMQIRAAQDVPGKTVTTTKPGSTTSGASSSDTTKLKSRADAINAKRLPYRWGGGHAGKVNAYQAQPLDCSGAVSAVLGINPKVASQFETFGKPGDGGSKGVTIAAKSTHVLMKIDGHWFGTSGSNPGGGAGWIPQDQISPEYLKGFTLRHA